MPSFQASLTRRAEHLRDMLVEFAEVEAASAIVLMVIAVLALIVANSPLGKVYDSALAAKLGPSWLQLSTLHWINDGFMALFFFLIGLEIKREVVAGALSSPRQATLPVVAAIAGVVLPAGLYLALNAGNPEALGGWGTPVATDIAFALGILALLGPRAPSSLKVFLTALAVLDDLLVILIIALFYTTQLEVPYLLLGGLGLLVLVGLNLIGCARVWAYLCIGALVWFFVLRSGIHATVAGVLVAFTVPIRTGSAEAADSPLHRLEHGLHPWVAWLIVPIFALANAGVSFGDVAWETAIGPVSIGIVVALFVGKQVGILAAVWLATRSGFADLPEGTTFRHIHGVAAVCGVGFTMSLFIGSLAFASEALENAAKIGILAGSLVSGVTGYTLLRVASGRELS